jgi:DinB superfamily
MTNTGRLPNSIAKMHQERERIVGIVQGLPQAGLDFQPNAKSWSIGQIAQHVALVEGGLMYIVQKMLQLPGDQRVLKVGYDQLPLTIKGIPQDIVRVGLKLLTPFSFLSRFVPRSMISWLIANPIIKAKAAPLAEPLQGTAQEGIVVFLSAVRECTMQVLENVTDGDISRSHWIHPLVGYQDLPGTLDLIANHDHRHIQQIANVRKNSQFPG